MERLDLSKWELFSTRALSKSYKSADGKFMLKTVDSNDKDAVNNLYEEQRVAHIVYSIGAPTPKAGDIFETNEGSIGLIYELIENKESFSRAISLHPENIEMYMKEFALTVKEFHSKKASEVGLPSFISRVEEGLKNTSVFTEAEKKELLEKLYILPDGNTCLHGDMQLSNAIHSPQGCYIIDLGTMSYGNPLFDVASFCFLSRYLPEELSKSILRVDLATLKKCWQLYAKYYFDTEDIASVEDMLVPYMKYCNLPILTLLPEAETVVKAKDFILSKG